MSELAKSALQSVFEQLKRYAIAYANFDKNLNDVALLVQRLGNSVSQYRDPESLIHSDFLAWCLELDTRLRRMEAGMRELKLSEKKLMRFFNAANLKQLKSSLDTDFDQIRVACHDWQQQLQTNAQLKMADKLGNMSTTVIVQQLVSNEESAETHLRALFKDAVRPPSALESISTTTQAKLTIAHANLRCALRGAGGLGFLALASLLRLVGWRAVDRRV